MTFSGNFGGHRGEKNSELQGLSGQATARTEGEEKLTSAVCQWRLRILPRNVMGCSEWEELKGNQGASNVGH